jgi:hypothetical protein
MVNSFKTTMTLLAAGLILSGGTKALRAQQAALAPVPLTSGTCAQVQDGGYVTLEWNPGFDHPASVLRVRRFTLSFDAVDEVPRAHPVAPALVLEAYAPHDKNGLPDSPITVGNNGFWKLRFQVSLHGARPGEYHLVAADAEAQVDAGYSGERPQMTNSPLRHPFCLNVQSVPQRIHK